MAEVNKIDINGYTMESIYTKIGISYDRFVEILDRDFYTPTLENPPTSSTLTYTDTDGSVCEFSVGQFCRVVDDTVMGGYRMYQCVDVQSGIGGTFVSWQSDMEVLKSYVNSEIKKIVVASDTEPNDADIWIDTSSEPEITIGINDAPADGNQYTRKDGEWSKIDIPDTSNFVTDSYFESIIKTKQDEIIDLENIREGASLGATALQNIQVPIIEQTDLTKEIQPNVYNKWGEVNSLTITLAPPSNNNSTNEYMVEFISGATATTLTLPDNLKFINGEVPTIDANKIYQLSILNNSVVIAGFATTN